MQAPKSPIFPPSRLTFAGDAEMEPRNQVLLPQLPEKPVCSTSTLQVYIIPAEDRLFLQGFDSQEYAERPPTLLRGCLWLRVLKPTRIRSLTLQFKGTERTDWPEGIPPKRNQTVETNDIISHTWPFYQSANTAITPNNGADFYRELPRHGDHDVSSLNLAETISRGTSPAPDLSSAGFLNSNLSPVRLVKRATTDAGSSFTSLADLSPISSMNDDSSKAGSFVAGDYIYNFEHPIHPSLPETTSVTFGSVFYHLEVSVARYGTFKPTLTGKIPIEIIRTPSEENLEENEPIVITRTWDDQIQYDIVVGAKSVILNTYLPLAFRFVPLFGKVALHRIRVYFTEHLEYYCLNKKVHRMEPEKKYLLLEHKAPKGHSLLSDSAVDSEEDVEILPRELEFQVYVPQVLNRYHNHMLHPDTSFTNIQAHHWIKICLRLSRNDESLGKRKHYEISIDSPIHVLSPQAAHGNTLLPAYETEMAMHAPQAMSSPPLSPDVTALSSNNDPNDLLARGYPLPVDRSGSPYRISSPMSEGEPIERDADMHLEANLYQPNPETIDPNLSASQAKPDTTISPLNSPMQRPIHVVRRPSFNPPTFEAATSPLLSGGPPLEAGPPPAYEATQSLSLSPLRIDDSQGASKDSPIAAASPFPSIVGSETPIKEMLRQHLGSDYHSAGDSDSRSNRSRSSKGTQSSGSSLTVGHNETDVTDTQHSSINSKPENVPVLNQENQGTSKSRQSSFSSQGSTSSDPPVEQTLPLLSQSTSSLDNVPTESRNSSTSSFHDHRVSNAFGAQRITEFVNGNFIDDLYKSGNLSSLRNPRLKKHYQEEQKTPAVPDKARQKSFGIVDALNGDDSSSNSTDSGSRRSTNDNTFLPEHIIEGKRVPGFNVDYIM
ncbi:Arrestin-related trafficking adapter [Meyerozyma sp. JA9]|nr:Arrestin-related trafficking adapter [Meyerozyma sp. JA9]